MHYFSSPDSSCLSLCPLHHKHPSIFSVLLTAVIEWPWILHVEWSVVSKETLMSRGTATEWINMNGCDKIWSGSESLIKGRQPVTYGMFLSGSGAALISVILLLCYWWLSVPDLSCWPLCSSHRQTHIQHTNTHPFIFTFSTCAAVILFVLKILQRKLANRSVTKKIFRFLVLM